MSKFDEQYLDLCERILKHGERVANYAGSKERSTSAGAAMPEHRAQADLETVTIRLPHQVLQFDLEEEFPILTTKKMSFKAPVLEMLWIWQVQSNDVRWLQERKIHIWDEWEIPEDGVYMGKEFGKEYAHTIGTAYGWIVKKYQLTQNLIETLKNAPGNRRMVLSLWQNEWLKTAALPSCVWSNEWNVTNGRLNVLVNSRSTDVPLGLPFNITQYAVFCYLLAAVLNLKPGQLTFVTNDAHIYENQIDGIKEQLKRDGLPGPRLWINPEIKDFFQFDNSRALKDIKLEGYQHLGKIEMPITA